MAYDFCHFILDTFVINVPNSPNHVYHKLQPFSSPHIFLNSHTSMVKKGKVIPLQAQCGPEGG
jgi:hypothetical protein